MDLPLVYQLFVATYHPDPSVHKQAELNIRNIEAKDGFLPIVLQILASEELELGARQAAAIYFKNRLNKAWDVERQSAVPINDNDRNMVKQNILQALVTTPNQVQVQLTSTLNTILTNDLIPETVKNPTDNSNIPPQNKWPEFVNELGKFLTSTDHRFIYVGLLTMREVAKVFQWVTRARRGYFRELLKLTFPTIRDIAFTLINNDEPEASEMLKLTFKIYYTSIQSELQETLQDTAFLNSWCTLFLQLIEKKIPDEVLPGDPEERENYHWWKTKKWAYHCLNRLFSKYGNSANMNKDLDKGFIKQFSHNIAPKIVNTYLKQIEFWIKKEIWIPSKCLALISTFFSDCVKNKITWNILKPHVETLVSHFIFPQLCFSDKDQELWDEDPVEFVHKRVDPLEDFHCPQTKAMELLTTLARDRKKHTFMGILNFVNGVLQKCLEPSEGQDETREVENAKRKDGALCMIGGLAYQVLQKKSPVANMMEPFFVTYVFPEFKSKHGFLKARACDLSRHFSDLEFSNEQNLATLYEHVINCIRDKELAVKVQACLALQPMIRHESVRNAMAPNLPYIMQELLNLTNEIDIDTLANVMEEFVEVFAEQLTPFAVQLCTQLRDTFLRIMEELNQNNTLTGADDEEFTGDIDELSDKTMAAMGVLKTIGTLILSLESTPETLQQLENALLPVITYTLENKVMDLYDEIFEIIDSCTFSAKRVTPTMWSVFEPICKAFKDSGIDYMEEMLAPLDNYISYGKDVFSTNAVVQGMMYEIIDTVMKSDRVGETGRICACKLMESVLLNCRGSVDNCVNHFLQLAFQYIFTGEMKTTEFKVHCIEVVINCIYYNPALSLQLLEVNNWTIGFFTLWFNTLSKFTRVHDKKLVIVTLCALLELPTEQIPASLTDNWQQILIKACDVFHSLPKAMENREEMEKLYGDFDDDFDDDFGEDDFSGADELSGDDEELDDEDVADQDNEYLEYLASQAAQSGPNEDVDEEDEEEEELEEEILFESPLDEIDPYVRFDTVFKSLQQNNIPYYTLLTKDLNSDQQNQIMTILTTAEKHRAAPTPA